MSKNTSTPRILVAAKANSAKKSPRPTSRSTNVSRQVFDHQVSQLAALPGEAAAAPVAVESSEAAEAAYLEIPATFATGMTDLLSNPEAIRQAIVFNEIFRRPEERWA